MLLHYLIILLTGRKTACTLVPTLQRLAELFQCPLGQQIISLMFLTFLVLKLLGAHLLGLNICFL
jgi:hypothetical protein